MLKSRNPGDLVSPELHHDTVVRPKEHAAAILAQVDREMVRNHWLFDADDEPSVGPDSSGEKDRALMDEFHPKYALFYNYKVLC